MRIYLSSERANVLRCFVIGALAIAVGSCSAPLVLAPETAVDPPALLVVTFVVASALGVGIYHLLLGIAAAFDLLATVVTPVARSPTVMKPYCDCGTCRPRATA